MESSTANVSSKCKQHVVMTTTIKDIFLRFPKSPKLHIQYKKVFQ